MQSIIKPKGKIAMSDNITFNVDLKVNISADLLIAIYNAFNGVLNNLKGDKNALNNDDLFKIVSDVSVKMTEGVSNVSNAQRAIKALNT